LSFSPRSQQILWESATGRSWQPEEVEPPPEAVQSLQYIAPQSLSTSPVPSLAPSSPAISLETLPAVVTPVISADTTLDTQGLLRYVERPTFHSCEHMALNIGALVRWNSFCHSISITLAHILPATHQVSFQNCSSRGSHQLTLPKGYMDPYSSMKHEYAGFKQEYASPKPEYSSSKQQYPGLKQEYSSVKQELTSPPPGSTTLAYYPSRPLPSEAVSANSSAGEPLKREPVYSYEYSQPPRAGYEATASSSSYAYAASPTPGYASSYAKCAKPIPELLSSTLMSHSSPTAYGSPQYSPQYNQNPSLYLPHPSTTTYSNQGYATSAGYPTPTSHYSQSVSSPQEQGSELEHAGNKVFYCNNPNHGNGGCSNRRMSTYSNLLRHNREQEGRSAKVYCPRCGRDFTRKTAMLQHMTNEKCKKASSVGQS
jgi:hypothetical protein